MVDLTAETILAQNGYTEADGSADPPTGDFTKTVVEYVIDDCIDTVNLLAAQTMSAMTGAAESKTVTITRAQAPAVKMLISLVLRENKKTTLTNSNTTSGSESGSSSASLGPASISESSSVGTAIGAAAAINNPANSVFVGLFSKAIAQLKKSGGTSMPIYVSNDPVAT
jgi:hypothetical protein